MLYDEAASGQPNGLLLMTFRLGFFTPCLNSLEYFMCSRFMCHSAWSKVV